MSYIFYGPVQGELLPDSPVSDDSRDVNVIIGYHDVTVDTGELP